jgi:hypothetical protein
VNKIFLLCLISTSLTLIGCAGTGANPIRVIQINDENFTCEEIKTEVNDLLLTAGFKRNEEQITDITNVYTWVLGQFLIFPLLAMDVTGSSEIERNAIFRRLERLQSFAQIKEC